jgi:3-methyladenine DNA glycosylase AlkC
VGHHRQRPAPQHHTNSWLNSSAIRSASHLAADQNLSGFFIHCHPVVSMPDSTPPPPLKDWFNEALYRGLARDLSSVAPGFARQPFLEAVLDGLDQRSLMARLHQCAVAMEGALPGTYRQQVRHLLTLAPMIRHEFVAIFLSDFVATFGLKEFDFSLEALRKFTVFGSAEFAVRTFLVAAQQRTLRVMHGWTEDRDEKVRRLASEGSRPRLPWGLRLTSLVRDPSPTAGIIEALKDDDSLFVRRSVANHLNDITKDHPGAVLERLSGWDLEQDHLHWIAKHSCRTLIKRGHPGALKLFGFGRKAEIAAALQASPARLQLGDRLTLAATLTSTSNRTQRLVVDYVVHYVKAGGGTSEKVFKWTEVELPARASLALTKSQVIRDFTTRRHYPGRHRVELQVNGARVATDEFHLG